MEQPTISVIIPTYNRPHLLVRAIRSIMNQTYQDFELIVADDASADNIEKVVRGFNDRRIRYARHSHNKGGSAARNTGIRLAKGEFIGFLDDDDEWMPEKLEKQLKKFQGLPEKIGVVYSGFCYVKEGGQEALQVSPSFRGKVYPNLLRSNFLSVLTPLVRKSCFEKVGVFDEILPGHQDWDMWLRLSKYFEFEFVPEVLAKYYVHGRQMSVDINARIQAMEKLMKRYQADLDANPSILSEHLRTLGKLYYIADRRREGRRYICRSISLEPLRIKDYLHLFLSIMAPGLYKAFLKRRQHTIGGIRFY